MLTYINQKVANKLIVPSKQFQIVPIMFYLLVGINSIMYRKFTFVLIELKKPHRNMMAPRK